MCVELAYPRRNMQLYSPPTSVTPRNRDLTTSKCTTVAKVNVTDSGGGVCSCSQPSFLRRHASADGSVAHYVLARSQSELPSGQICER